MPVVCISRHATWLDRPSGIEVKLRMVHNNNNNNTHRQTPWESLPTNTVKDAVTAPRVHVLAVGVATVPVAQKGVMDARRTTTVSTKQHLEGLSQCMPGNELLVQRLRIHHLSCRTQKFRGKTDYRLKAVICLFPVKIAGQQ